MIQYQQASPERSASNERFRKNLSGLFDQSNEAAIETQQYEKQKGRLEKAFKNIQPNQPFLEQLKKIAPELLSTPGGSQALSELAPVLAKQSQAESIGNALSNRGQNQSQGQFEAPNRGQNQPNEPINVKVTPDQQQTGGATYDQLRNPQVPYSPENTFPERTAGPKTHKVMSPDEMHEATLDLMRNASTYGSGMEYGPAAEIVQNRNNQYVTDNARIDQEKASQLAAERDLTRNMVDRAMSEGLVQSSSPEDKAVAEKLALIAKNAPSEVAAWDYVKTGLSKYKNARDGIKRESLSYPSSKYMFGDYKSKEQIYKNIKPNIDVYKKYGLIPELRNDLLEGPGFGPEDIEEAIFPIEGNSKIQLDQFYENPNKFKGILKRDVAFPAQESKLSPDNYAKFKDDLARYLNDNPGVNLVSLRAKLNQGKGYSWQDISATIGELITENKFAPDNIQDQQRTIINNHPIPGLGAFFKFTLKGTK